MNNSNYFLGRNL